MRTTIGQLLIDNALPADMRGRNRVLDKKGSQELFQELAEKHPDKYREYAQKLLGVGRDVAFTSGGYSVGVDDLLPSLAARKMRLELGQKLRAIYGNTKLDEKSRNAAIIELASSFQKKLVDDVYNEAIANNNPLGLQAISGTRGNKFNVNSLLGADMLYNDHRGEIVPIAVQRSYSQGLRPAEYFAGSFGARKGIFDLKCLDGLTPVLMADGTVKAISKIRPGEYVMGADCRGVMSPTRVVNVFENGRRECWRYTFRVGSCRKRFVELIATEDHKILAQIRDGQPGSTYAYRSVYTPTPLPLKIARLQKKVTKNTFVAWPARGTFQLGGRHEPRALLLGLLLGDANLAERGHMTLSCGDPLLIADIAGYLASLNLCAVPPKQKEGEATRYGYYLTEISKTPQLRSATGARFGTTGNPIKQWLHSLGLPGKLAPQKILPSDVWTWDDASVDALLAGLYATDGCIEVLTATRHCNVKFKSTSKKLVEQVQQLVELRLGAWGHAIRRIPKEQIPLGNYDQFEFTISHTEAVRRFASRVRLPGAKQLAIDAAIANASTYHTATECGFKIVRREAAGTRKTYDLEVEHPDHLFVLANGLVVSNSATADAGFFAKQLSQAAHRLVVSDIDDDTPYDQTMPRGLPSDVDDADNVGALLAHPAGEYPRNTLLTPKILKELKSSGVQHLLVRSPTVGGPRDGSVYARDVGRREKGYMAPRGDFVGLAASQALSEPVTQSQISSKHSGGVVGAGAGAISGFKLFNNLVQVPEVFNGAAAHAQVDGRVTDVRPAPQGGNYVTINGEQHYVGKGYDVNVKVGDEVEAGDTISGGIPNPAEVVRHKGVGEGRRYFTEAFRKAMKDAGVSGHRRNIELLSRGLINHVRLNDEVGDWAPDDVIPYQSLEASWKPRNGFTDATPQQAIGQYLERPILHHTIGTRVTRRMLPELQRFGVATMRVHRDPPPFEPEMIRGMANVAHDPDWMTRMLGSYQKHSLLSAAHRGAVSDASGSSYVPALAQGTTFGSQGLTQGWKPPAP